MTRREWYAQVWPWAAGKAAVHAGYESLRSMPHVLADIALRNHVFSPCADQVAEGRRRAALEILKLCKMDPSALWDVIEAKPRNEERRP
jgi:hypothetical protein